MFKNLFDPEKFNEAIEIIKSQFLLSTWETIYVTILSTLFTTRIYAMSSLFLGFIMHLTQSL